MKKIEAFCAHTMIAKLGHKKFPLVCCDCGRAFSDKLSVEAIQEYETETGYVCPDKPYSPM